MIKPAILIISIIICLSAGAIGGVFTSKSIPTWYANLEKPSFNPPNWVFGPVWTVLYVLMGVALWLFVKDGYPNIVKLGIALFAAQLVLNVMWSVIFFGMQDPMLAFVEIIALWLAIALTIVVFYMVKPASAYMLVPYILWVSFAAVLNFSIWRLNG